MSWIKFPLPSCGQLILSRDGTCIDPKVKSGVWELFF